MAHAPPALSTAQSAGGAVPVIPSRAEASARLQAEQVLTRLQTDCRDGIARTVPRDVLSIVAGYCPPFKCCAVVIDIGSHTTKCGVVNNSTAATAQDPPHTFTSSVTLPYAERTAFIVSGAAGRPPAEVHAIKLYEAKGPSGLEAGAMFGPWTLWPVSRGGRVGSAQIDWIGFQSILAHVFSDKVKNDLKAADPAAFHPIIVVTPPTASAVERERIVEHLFTHSSISGESGAVPGVALLDSAVCALATGLMGAEYADGKEVVHPPTSKSATAAATTTTTAADVKSVAAVASADSGDPAASLTGVVVDIGESVTRVTPVWRGHSVVGAVRESPVAGGALVRCMTALLTERGYSFTTTAERDLVRDIIRMLAFVSLDFEADCERAACASALSRSYELPDGQVITIEEEKFMGPELLFRPLSVHTPDLCADRKVWGSPVLRNNPAAGPYVIAEADRHAPAYASIKGLSLGRLIAESVAAAALIIDPKGSGAVDFRALGRVVLAGGVSCLSGLPERLSLELPACAADLRAGRPDTPHNLKGGGAPSAGVASAARTVPVKDADWRVVAPADRRTGAWSGAALLSTLSSFQQSVLTRAQFKERGAKAILEKDPNPFAIA